jgi:hypothetical protein
MDWAINMILNSTILFKDTILLGRINRSVRNENTTSPECSGRAASLRLCVFAVKSSSIKHPLHSNQIQIELLRSSGLYGAVLSIEVCLLRRLEEKTFESLSLFIQILCVFTVNYCSVPLCLCGYLSLRLSAFAVNIPSITLR